MLLISAVGWLRLRNLRREITELKVEMQQGDSGLHERANMMNEDIGNLYAELEGVDSDLGRLITSSKLNSASIKAVDKRLRSLENVTNKMIAEKKEAEEKKSQKTTKAKTNTEEVHEVFAETSDDVPEGMTFAGTYELTAYTATGNPTADGTMPSVGVTVACNDPSLWHRWIYIEGYGTYYCHDTGGMSVNVIDIFVGSYDEAIQFGRRSANVYLVN